MRHFGLALGAAAALSAVAGCGSRNGILSGVVTLDGKPLDNGTMQFFPVKGDGQTGHAVLEADGRYRSELSPTKMKVVIHSNKLIGRRKAYENVPDSPLLDINEEVLPPRYSDMNKTELTIDVVPGHNTADFDLKSDRKK